jgi:hypothetical protein
MITVLTVWVIFSVFYLAALFLSGRISNYNKPYTFWTYVETVLIVPAAVLMTVISGLIWLYEETK